MREWEDFIQNVQQGNLYEIYPSTKIFETNAQSPSPEEDWNIDTSIEYEKEG